MLWVVPSDQIYKDTLKALRDRRHFYRESLEHALSRRLEVWEKQDITRLTPGQLPNNLNMLLLKLPGTNRQDRESLKFFRDSGGNIVLHFPPEDEPDKHRELKAARAQSGHARGRTGAGQLPRRRPRWPTWSGCASRPSSSTRATRRPAPWPGKPSKGFNPSIVVELSATPAKTAPTCWCACPARNCSTSR